VGRGLRGRDDGGNVNNVQYKSNQNCHYKSPLYNEYTLIKIYNNYKKETDGHDFKKRAPEGAG
jgi:hypothetical protein